MAKTLNSIIIASAILASSSLAQQPDLQSNIESNKYVIAKIAQTSRGWTDNKLGKTSMEYSTIQSNDFVFIRIIDNKIAVFGYIGPLTNNEVLIGDYSEEKGLIPTCDPYEIRAKTNTWKLYDNPSNTNSANEVYNNKLQSLQQSLNKDPRPSFLRGLYERILGK
jgi:hypothetical protein